MKAKGTNTKGATAEDIEEIFDYFNQNNRSRLGEFVSELVEGSPKGKEAEAVFDKVEAELSKTDKHFAMQFKDAVTTLIVAHQDLVFPVGFAMGQTFGVPADLQRTLNGIKGDLKKAEVVPWPKEQTAVR